MTITDELIEEIKDEMKIQKLTAAKLSDKTGISRQMISCVFNGTRNLRFKTAEKLANGLGKTVVLYLADLEE